MKFLNGNIVRAKKCGTYGKKSSENRMSALAARNTSDILGVDRKRWTKILGY